MEDCGLGETLG